MALRLLFSLPFVHVLFQQGIGVFRRGVLQLCLWHVHAGFNFQVPHGISPHRAWLTLSGTAPYFWQLIGERYDGSAHLDEPMTGRRVVHIAHLRIRCTQQTGKLLSVSGGLIEHSKTENQDFRKSKVTEAQTPATSMIFENRKSGLSICSGYIAGKVFHINDSRFSKSLPLSFNQTNTFLAVQFCE